MTGSQARRIVVGSITAAGAFSTVRAFRDGETPRLRILIGALGAAIVLAMVSEVAPDVAAGLALVALVSSVLTSGALLDDFTKLLGRAAPSSPGSPIPPPAPVATPVWAGKPVTTNPPAPVPRSRAI